MDKMEKISTKQISYIVLGSLATLAAGYTIYKMFFESNKKE